LERFAENGVQSVRLDAVGYAVKKAGESCFMMPKTYRYISEITERAHELNIEVLVEIHSHYSEQIKIAKIVDYVYDFSLPPLVLYTLFSGNANPLKKWLSISPQNCITVLDTHDGIGIMDVAPGSKGPGLLDEHQIHFLVECIHRSCNDQSRKSTGHAANNLDIYQINSTFYSALGADDNLYLLSRLIQFVCPGIPQVYYVGLLAGENDMTLLSQTSVGRDINRHYYDQNEIENQLNKTVVQNLISLINFRNKHPAFKGKFSLIESLDETLKIVWSGQGCKLFIEIFLDIKEFSIVSIINDEIEQFRSWECIQSYSELHDTDIPNKEVMNDEQLNN
jgi:sucrose phosphorylase